jgi:hypothetical protein
MSASRGHRLSSRRVRGMGPNGGMRTDVLAAPESRFALAYQRLAEEDAERSRWLDAHKDEGDDES